MTDGATPVGQEQPGRKTPDELLDELSVPTRLGSKPGLERVRSLLAALGDPQRGLPVVHVGGTSGKGSTATVIAAILQAAGYRVGLHTKPHLQAVEERFVVNGQPIASRELASLLEEVAPAARATTPSWHELTTALMLLHFRRKAVDVAVVEVGLGGTYDSTNVVQPHVAVLTNVGLDHMEVLGDTVEEIAQDKVGIVKPGCIAVTGVRQPTVEQIVLARCESVGVPVLRLHKEISCRLRAASAAGATMDVEACGRRLEELRLGLIGQHQVENAALAVAAALALESRGFAVADAAIREALATVRVPGRMEVLRTRPTLLLDGAHNPDKMRAMAAALRSLFSWRRLIGVLAFKRGHDHQATMAALAPLLDVVFLTRFVAATDFGRDTSQGMDELVRAWLTTGSAAELIVDEDPIRSTRRALDLAGPEDVVCVTGSLYLVGQVRRWSLGSASEPAGQPGRQA